MTVLVAGATGNLGGRIVRALLAADATVAGLARPGGSGEREAALAGAGARVVTVDLKDGAALDSALAGVTTVVSALQGLEPVILDAQTTLLQAAVRAGVQRFIPSDFALDFFKTRPGSNRNFDLRRRFDERLDAASIRATSILNGAFMDLLGPGAGDHILDRRRGRVSYFGDPDQKLDFTTMDDTAAFTARAALDAEAPRILRIAGEQITPRGLAAAATQALGRPIDLRRAGSLGMLRLLIRVARFVAPGRGNVMPAWQRMQYAENMFGGDGLLEPLDNHRYPSLTWTGVADFLRRR